MASLARKALTFFGDPKGGVSLLLVFLFAVLMGITALAVDLVRYFGAKSAILQATHVSSELISKNSLFVPENTLRRVSETAAGFELGGLQNGSLLTKTAVLKDLTFSYEEERKTLNVALTAEIPTTLMSFFSFSENLQVSAEIQSGLYTDPVELVIVLDRSLGAASSGKLGIAQAALTVFLDQLMRLPRKEGAEQIAVGLIPFGNAYTNVSPYKSWVEAGAWPTEYPPEVPGSVTWSGLLEEQRWCVDVREGSAGMSSLSPALQKFPLILDLQMEVDPETGEALYSVATDPACSDNPVLPLQRTIPAVKQAISETTGHGDAMPGRALVWAERVLSADWAADWNIEAGLPAANLAETSKMVLMISNSEAASIEDQALLADKCQALKAEGVTLHVLDYSESESLQAALRICANPAHAYREISDDGTLAKGLTEIARSLLKVRITAVSYK